MTTLTRAIACTSGALSSFSRLFFPYLVSVSFCSFISNPCRRFVEKLREQVPGVLEEALSMIEEEDERRRKQLWKEKDGIRATFTFDFKIGEDGDSY